MKRQHGLLLDILDGDEPHRRPSDRFADRFGLGNIVLVALDVRSHDLWRNQLDGVSQRLQLASPVMRLAAGLHADQARRQVGEEGNKRVALQLLAKNRLAVLVRSAHLEQVLCQVDSDCRNLHGGRSFRIVWWLTLPLWHIDAVSGWGRPSHCLQYVYRVPKAPSDNFNRRLNATVHSPAAAA
jgi:hypothetical protein